MNKNKQKQSGFAHLAVVIILSVALLGTLGFVFWQNFMQPKVVVDDIKKDDSGTKIDDTKKPVLSEVALTEIASDQTRGSGLSIKYPKTWTMVHKGAVDISPLSGSDADTSTITSPDGEISVVLVVGLSGIGGTCDPNDTNYRITQIDTGTIVGYPSQSFVSSVTHSISENKYYYRIGTVSTGSVGELVVGGSNCAWDLGVISTDYDNNGPVAQLVMPLKNVENGTSTTLTDLNKVTPTDNYKIAKRIMQSLYVK